MMKSFDLKKFYIQGTKQTNIANTAIVIGGLENINLGIVLKNCFILFSFY